MVLLASEESLLVRHPEAGDDVVLDEATNRLAGCWHEILVVGISNKTRLRPGNLIF